MSTTTAPSPTVARPAAPSRLRGPAGRAVRDILPIAAAVVPFGTVIGVTLEQAGLVGLPALAGTALLYAGSAQLATLTILIAGGGPIGAVLAGVIVNTRMVLYSASHGHRFRSGHPGWFRWVAPLMTVDQTFALAGRAGELAGRDFRRYWVTMGLVLGSVWLTATAVGMRLGAMAAEEASPLAVAAPATMVALLVPHLDDARMRRVALVAAVVAVVGRVLPSGLGIIAAIVVALVAAGPSPQDEPDGTADEAREVAR
jgi:4-azaleucine resistance transporter AzlC